MNDIIKFNTEVNNHLKDTLKSEKWSGTTPVFYKNDVPNLIKCIEVRRSLKQDHFSCNLSVYSDFKFSNSPKGKAMHTHKQLFLVALTPEKVTSSSYHWPLKDTKDFNTQQMHTLWEAIAGHGTLFFNRFNNFPDAFLDIEPEDFKRGDVKLFNEYDVYSQINYMNFLKEIHVSLHHIEKATAFSDLALAQFHKNIKGKNVLHDKAYDKTVKEYLNFLKMPKTP